MKSNRLLAIWMISILGICLSSCYSAYYRIITKIDKDGSCIREVYAKADSSFLAGDMSHNPYMFVLDAGWKIEPINTTDTDIFSRYSKDDDYNVKISKEYASVKDLPAGLQFDEILRPVVAPDESLQKHFRWFYTYYSFKGVYANISEKIPVPIHRFMNEEEQKMWLQGDFSSFAGMNGFELKDEMDETEKKFWTWYLCNLYDAHYDAIVCFDKHSGNGSYVKELIEIKDTLFLTYTKKKDIESLSFDLSDIAEMLDQHFSTSYFKKLCKENEKTMLQSCGEKISHIENLVNSLFDKHIEYNLVIPGKITYTNAPLSKQDTLVWNVNALRLVSDDYLIVATSRTVHIWAFIVTALLVMLSVCCFIRLARLKK